MSNEQQEKKKRNKPVLIALIGAGALLATVGGVYAANSITINGGSAIEFGQGIQSTSTCDSGLTTAINQSYVVADSKFEASTVVVSGIKDFACAGKTLHVSLIGASGTVCSVDGTHTTGTYKDAFTINDGGTVGTDDDTSETVTIATGCDASTISKVAITTS
jgi:hypothetical protein